MGAKRTADRLQRQYAEYIAKECNTGVCKADHIKADEAIIRYLAVIGCDDLVDAWKSVEKCVKP